MSEQKKIISMFNSIADRYDISSNVVSFGIESIWKKESIQRAIGYLNTDAKLNIVDLACGTGSMIEQWKKVLKKNRISEYKIAGVDPSSKMLDIAKSRFEDIDFFEAQADKMPLEDESVDAISISYGVRNIVNINSSLDEIYRVLKKDGVLLVLEFFADRGKTSYVSYFKNLYIKYVIPLVGGAISKNKASFQYLSSSIQAFDTTKEFQDKLANSGLEAVYVRGFTFNVSHCMVITKSKEPIKKTKPSKSENKNNTNIGKTQNKAPFSRALKTVGMKCFISYYKYFSDTETSSKELVAKMIKDSNYTKESCHSKISNAKFIISNGYTKEAIEFILKSSRVDDSTKRKARSILKTIA